MKRRRTSYRENLQRGRHLRQAHAHARVQDGLARRIDWIARHEAEREERDEDLCRRLAERDAKA